MSVSSGFPKALSYSIRQMADNMSRVGVKMTPDRTTGIAPNDTITFKLPNNSLVDLRSLNFFYQFSTSGGTGTFIHPRYSSSLIERISVIINGQTVSVTPAYALLYNTLMDMEGSSFDQLSKRNVCEFFDPSIRITADDPTSSADVSLAGGTWIKSGTSAPSKIDGAITHWLGFLGSTNPSVIDTSMGDIFIQIQFSTAYVLPSTINSTSQTLAGASFTLDNVYATCDVISFSSDTYYRALASKLTGEGLNIGFYEYLNARFASITKSSGVNITWNLTANSLDQLITTFQKTDAYSTWKPMIVYGSNEVGSTVYTMAQIASNPTSYLDNQTGGTTVRTEKLGDGFMNAYAFIRNGQAFKEGRYSINNRPINYGFLTPKEVFIQTLQALGYNQQDLGTNGLNMCIFSLQHFLKYYFCHIIDLTIQDSRDFWISGLNSLGSTLSITYECNFNGSSNSQTAIPVMYARLSKILNVRDGRQLSVI